MIAKVHNIDVKPACEHRNGTPSLLRVCQDEHVTLEAIARASDVDARDECGATALHHICAHARVSPALIRAVGALLAPETVAAATTGQSKAFVFFPEIGWQQPPESCALHVLASNRSATPACLEALHALDPTLIARRDTVGTTPLCPVAWWGYWGASAADQVAMIRAGAALDPAVLRVGNHWDYTPLHMICWVQAYAWVHTHKEAVTALYELWPEAASRIRDDVRELLTGKPIVTDACRRPEGLRAVDNEGRTPLVMLCARGGPSALLRHVAALDPAVTAELQLTPLHLACCARDATIDTVKEAAADPDAARAADARGLTPLDCLRSKDDPALCAALCAALPLEAFAVLKGQKASLLHTACRTEEGAAIALAGVFAAHTSGATDTLMATDPAILPKLLRLTGASLEHASCTPCVKKLVDSINARPGPVAVLLLDLELNLVLAVCYALFAVDLRDGKEPARSPAGLGAAAVACYTLARKAAHLRAMRRLGLFSHYASDPFILVEWLACLWVALTFAAAAAGVGPHALDRVCAFGALCFAWKFLAFLRQLSVQLARFVRALLMIARDIAAFVVVLLIAVVGFGEALYFILAPRKGDGADSPFDSPEDTLLVMVATLLGSFDINAYGRVPRPRRRSRDVDRENEENSSPSCVVGLRRPRVHRRLRDLQRHPRHRHAQRADRHRLRLLRQGRRAQPPPLPPVAAGARRGARARAASGAPAGRGLRPRARRHAELAALEPRVAGRRDGEAHRRRAPLRVLARRLRRRGVPLPALRGDGVLAADARLRGRPLRRAPARRRRRGRGDDARAAPRDARRQGRRRRVPRPHRRDRAHRLARRRGPRGAAEAPRREARPPRGHGRRTVRGARGEARRRRGGGPARGGGHVMKLAAATLTARPTPAHVDNNLLSRPTSA